MSIPRELPGVPLRYNGYLSDIEIAEQKKGELFLAVDGDSREYPENLKALLNAVTDGRMEIDGKKVKATILHRHEDDKTLLYFDWTGESCGAEIADGLDVECWKVVSDGKHNSNSFLTFWRNRFYLIHANSPYHFATPECKLMLWSSEDAHEWELITTFSVPDEDIRDPKFAIIHDRLFIYVLKSFVADGSEPYTTAYTYTDDGVNFQPLTDLLDNHGWLFWNPRTNDNKTWYVPAYWGGHGNSIMLKTEDGIHFKPVCYIHQGKKGLVNDRNDETDFAFMGDGTLISTQRLEFSEDITGDKLACTHLAICRPPYEKWEPLGKDYHTRLDGPSLFEYNGRVYAVGRRNPYDREEGPNYIGSVFGRKRTSLYEVTVNGLIFLTDFPSAGDTSYGGCVLKDGRLYASYYSSPLDSDWPWYVGMLSPSDIRMVKIPLNQIEALADRRREEYDRDGKYLLVRE